MIRYITRDSINIEAYTNCISNAINARIYAESWYLDIVADKNWDILVLDDYSAVMPLPKRRKYFIHYIFLPPWCQQLGVFSKDKMDVDIVERFLSAIPKKFKLVDMYLNTENSTGDRNSRERTNYVLPLNRPYEMLWKNYNKGRKSSVKQAVNNELKIVEQYHYQKIIELFKLHKGIEIPGKIDYNTLHTLIERGLQLKYVQSIGVTNKNNELIGGAMFLKSNKRITYLFSSLNTEGREKQAMSFVLDFIIQKFSNTDNMLDFEGSMMTSIAHFIKSFGAEKESYYHYKKYRL